MTQTLKKRLEELGVASGYYKDKPVCYLSSDKYKPPYTGWWTAVVSLVLIPEPSDWQPGLAWYNKDTDAWSGVYRPFAFTPTEWGWERVPITVPASEVDLAPKRFSAPLWYTNAWPDNAVVPQPFKTEYNDGEGFVIIKSERAIVT